MPTTSSLERETVSQRRRALHWLCLLLVALQVADAGSTYLALRTGLARETNELLVSMAAALGWPVMQMIFAAKALVAACFAAAMFRTKPTTVAFVLLTGVALYFAYIVAKNLYWAWVFSTV